MTEHKGNREHIKEQLLEDLRKTLSKEELAHIKAAREFASVKRSSPSWAVGVTVDPIRMQMRKSRSVVEKSLWQIENLKVKIARIKKEIATNTIRDEVKPGVPMTPEEAALEMKYAEWLIEGELQSLPLELWKMRATVGQEDVAGQVILGETEFDLYLASIKRRVEELGYVLF